LSSTLSLHDALPISKVCNICYCKKIQFIRQRSNRGRFESRFGFGKGESNKRYIGYLIYCGDLERRNQLSQLSIRIYKINLQITRSEEHTSELQSREK